MTFPAPERARRALTVALACLAILACGILDEGAPETARIVISGPTHPVRLVTSSDFDAVTRADGDGRDVTVFSADTAAVSVPFDQRYGLGARGRIFVLVGSDTTAVSPVTLQVYIDGELRFQRSTRFAGGDVMEFVFTSTSLR